MPSALYFGYYISIWLKYYIVHALFDITCIFTKKKILKSFMLITIFKKEIYIEADIIESFENAHCSEQVKNNNSKKHCLFHLLLLL